MHFCPPRSVSLMLHGFTWQEIATIMLGCRKRNKKFKFFPLAQCREEYTQQKKHKYGPSTDSYTLLSYPGQLIERPGSGAVCVVGNIHHLLKLQGHAKHEDQLKLSAEEKASVSGH